MEDVTPPGQWGPLSAGNATSEQQALAWYRAT